MRLALHNCPFAVIAMFLSMFAPALGQSTATPAGQDRVRSADGFQDWSSYFPLKVGNEWLYSDGEESFAVQVLRETQEANGWKYFEVTGYFPDDPSRVRKLRHGSPGEILEYNPEGKDFLWYRFGLYKGAWRFEMGGGPPCIAGSQLRTGNYGDRLEVAAGTFVRTLRIDFLSPCADAGISNESFAGGIGLVRRTMTTIAGPMNVELVWANVDSLQLPAAAVSVEVSVDRPVYFNDPKLPAGETFATLRARLTVRNGGRIPVELTYATGQRFDFVVRDESGIELLRWSDGRAFTMLFGQEILSKGERSYSVELPLKDRSGRRLPAGSYTLTGHLTTVGSEAGFFAFGGSVPFEIRDLR